MKTVYELSWSKSRQEYDVTADGEDIGSFEAHPDGYYNTLDCFELYASFETVPECFAYIVERYEEKQGQ